jgi:probable phosphomutase (TIGR03848 family)
MTILLLIRHGQNDWVSKKRLAGRIAGVHLNAEGRKQAQQTAERLAHLPIKAIYSSPLERCWETAEAIAEPHQLPILELDEVAEVRYGQWEGEKLKKLAKQPEWAAVQHFPSRFRFPDGESLLEVQQRAVAALERVCSKHEKEMIAVVSHADVIKLVLAHYLGVHIDLFQRIGLSPAAVSVVALSKHGVQVLRINDDGPLQAPAVEEKKKEKKKEGKKEIKQTTDSQAGEVLVSGDNHRQ